MKIVFTILVFLVLHSSHTLAATKPNILFIFADDQSYETYFTGKPDPWSPGDPKFGGFWHGGKHWSELLGDDKTDPDESFPEVK